MLEFFEKLFAQDFMPHGHCYFWQPEILSLHVGSDAVVALSYFSIPLTLFFFVRRRDDLAFKHVFVLFAAFIFACGSTHVLEAITVWKPAYRFEGVVKLGTAIVSAATAVVLWRLIPHALALPSPRQLAEANEKLQSEVHQRERAQEELRTLNRDLEARVARRTEELRRSNQDLEQFAYVASHDLQEPLRAVSSYVQLLERRYKGSLDERADKYIGYAVDGAVRMRALIDDLLTYSRAAQQEQRLVQTNAEEAFEHAMRNAGYSASESDVSITHDPLPMVRADRTQLTQIFQNLLSNAIKYASDRPLRVHVWADRDDDDVVFHVQDNGIGVPAEYRRSIFDPFRRLHTRDKYPGSGLGLSICKRLVERHGGRIWVESTHGEGSTFHFRMPHASS